MTDTKIIDQPANPATGSENVRGHPARKRTTPMTLKGCHWCGKRVVRNTVMVVRYPGDAEVLRWACPACIAKKSEVEMPKIADQPPPQPNNRPAVWDLVIADMRERDHVGRERYGTPLQPHNGRDALVDAYQEALDLVVYLRQAIEERR